MQHRTVPVAGRGRDRPADFSIAQPPELLLPVMRLGKNPAPPDRSLAALSTRLTVRLAVLQGLNQPRHSVGTWSTRIRARSISPACCAVIARQGSLVRLFFLHHANIGPARAGGETRAVPSQLVDAPRRVVAPRKGTQGMGAPPSPLVRSDQIDRDLLEEQARTMLGARASQ